MQPTYKQKRQWQDNELSGTEELAVPGNERACGSGSNSIVDAEIDSLREQIQSSFWRRQAVALGLVGPAKFVLKGSQAVADTATNSPVEVRD